MSNKTKWAIGAAVGVPTVALMAFVASFWGRSLASWFIGQLAVTWVFWLMIAILGGLGVWAARAYHTSNGRDLRPTYVTIISVVVVIALMSTMAWLYSSVGAVKYQEVFTESSDPIPAVEERSSYVQANALLRTNVGGLQGQPTDAVHLGDSQWSVVMSGSGLGLGTTAVVVWDGDGETSSNFRTCPMEGVPGLGGLWANSLPRAMRQVVPIGPYSFELDDIYGYCDDDGKGVVIAPLTMRGWNYPAIVSYGGLVEARSGGEMIYHSVVEPGQFPGPVYPVGLVERVERANGGRRGSVSDTLYSNDMLLREDTEPVVENVDPNAAEGGSPNADNYGQFVLTGADGALWAVTPMQRAKSSVQVVSVAYTRVDQGTAGEINPVTLYTLPQFRKSGTEVQRTLRGAFADLNWVGGRRVFEITPVDQDTWVGTIGTTVYASQRFTIGPDGTICVFDLPSGKSRGCSADDGSGSPTTEGGPTTGTDTPAGNPDLQSADLGELITQRDEIQAEIDRRARSATGG